jgi:hypothetical protein
MQTLSLTTDVATFRATLDAVFAVRLPVKNLIKRYVGEEYDDFGVKRRVIISSTEYADENGLVTWSEHLGGVI